jgi:hypothetical protein
LSCPSCRRLVYADRLKSLAEGAEAGERAGEPSAALADWNEALSLLPPESRQYATIAEKIAGLGAFIRLKQAMPDPRQDARVGVAGPIWGLGAALACLAAYLVRFPPT